MPPRNDALLAANEELSTKQQQAKQFPIERDTE
jgi:hypothetical protein